MGIGCRTGEDCCGNCGKGFVGEEGRRVWRWREDWETGDGWRSCMELEVGGVGWGWGLSVG